MTEQSTDSGFKAFSKALELFPRRARRTTVEQMRNGRPFLSPQFDNEHIQLAAALASEQWLKATPKRPEVYLLAIADKCFEM